MKELYLRHGDVYIFTTDEIPKTAKKVKHHTLAEGEQTGHAHRLSPTIDLFEDTDGTLYFQPPAEAAVNHEQHGLAPLVEIDKPHETTIQREWNHYQEEAQKVRD